jgi:hypothetical protein
MSFDEFYKSLSHYKEWYLSKGKTSSERYISFFISCDENQLLKPSRFKAKPLFCQSRH